MSKTRISIIFFVLLTAVLVCYGGTINSGFIWDDNFLIKDNSLIRAPILSFQQFKQDIVNSSFTYSLYYRPLQVLSYALDYRIWGMDPAGFHLTNVFLHFFNALLLFYFVFKLTKNEVIAFLSGLFFSVHPVNVPAVAYISGRADMLYFLFGMLSLIFFIRFRETRKFFYICLSLFSFILSVFSKEYGLVFITIIPLIDLVLYRQEKVKPRILSYLFFMVFGILYLIFHYAFLGAKYGIYFSSNAGYVKQLPFYFKTIGDFLILSIFPFGIGFRNSFQVLSFAFMLKLSLILSVILISVFLMKKYSSILRFSIISFFLCIVPVLFILRYFNVYAEHWMYLACVWMILFFSAVLVGAFSGKVLGKKILMSALVLVGVVAYSRASISQAGYFSGSIILEEKVLKTSAKDKAANFYRSVDLYKTGKEAEASLQIDGLVEQYPLNAHIRYLAGRLNLSLDEYAQAKKNFLKSIELNDRYENAYVGMALYNMAEKDMDTGISYLEKALKINPYHPEALKLLGMAYYDTGQNEKAFDVITRSIEVDPFGYDAIVNMGTVLTREGKTVEGGRYYLRAVKLYPEKPVPYYNLAYLFFLSGDMISARYYATKAVMLDASYRPAIDLIYKIRLENLK